MLLVWLFIIPHTLLSPGKIPPLARSGPVPLYLRCVAGLGPTPLQMGCKREEPLQVCMSFEMVRSSVYIAVQMKVSHEEMHKAEGEVGVAGGRVCRRGREDKRGLFQQPTPYLHHCHCSLGGFIPDICLHPSSYLSFSIAPLIKDKEHETGSRRGFLRGTKCMDIQKGVCKWLCSAQIYVLHILKPT